jgi:hypothetical protein
VARETPFALNNVCGNPSEMFIYEAKQVDHKPAKNRHMK